MGLPSNSDIQFGRRSALTLVANDNLLPAIAEVAASNKKGGLFLAGAAMAIGFVPNLGSAPKVGSTDIPPAVAVIPTISCFAAIIA